ncbi:hypothetical protein WN943_026396 [Citrus x changshan-huyou]
MEHEAFKLTKKQNRLPPARGQVLKKILNDWFGSAGGKRRGNGLVSRDGKNLRWIPTRGGPAHSGPVLALETLQKILDLDQMVVESNDHAWRRSPDFGRWGP